MIVLDGSALFAILLREPEGRRCLAALAANQSILLSAGSLAEMLIVAARKDLLDDVQGLLTTLQPTVVPLTEDRAQAAAAAYRRWGEGFDPARLNICDSFAYALAVEHDCPLLFVGDDFARTDIVPAI